VRGVAQGAVRLCVGGAREPLEPLETRFAQKALTTDVSSAKCRPHLRNTLRPSEVLWSGAEGGEPERAHQWSWPQVHPQKPSSWAFCACVTLSRHRYEGSPPEKGNLSALCRPPVVRTRWPRPPVARAPHPPSNHRAGTWSHPHTEALWEEKPV
jgi:hypothetical protein